MDWIGDKIYFSTGYTIRACDLEGHNCTGIVSTHHGYVWSVAVDPYNRYIISCVSHI